jgi:hypothetical protein
MTTLTLLPPLPVEDTRTRKPNRRPGSCPSPSNVIPLPAPDPDTPVVARYLMRQGWTWVDAFHAGLDANVGAMMLAIETAPS